jgi:hypothetical protein
MWSGFGSSCLYCNEGNAKPLRERLPPLDSLEAGSKRLRKQHRVLGAFVRILTQHRRD